VAERGSILSQQTITIQVLNPVRSPSGSVDPQWVDAVVGVGAKITPLSAAASLQFQQQGVTVSHKVRFDGRPTWTPINAKDKGFFWPGTTRFSYTDADGQVRILLYKGSYSPAEAGRWTTVVALEESWQDQFAH
jgi:hypothetical protein